MFAAPKPPPPAKNRLSLRPNIRRTATPLAGANMTRSVLPAEIIAQILDYLPVQDQLSFARVSKRLQDMVYDDTRWVYRLKLMGVWNEVEARKRFEDAMRKRRAAEAAKRAEEDKKTGQVTNGAAKGGGAGGARGSVVFDVGEEEKRAHAARQKRAEDKELDLLSIGPATEIAPGLAPGRRMVTDAASLLTVLENVRSVRGFARQEYGRIFGALGPLYFDLVVARTHNDPMVFRIFREPEEQAKVLNQLVVFAKSDTAQGWYEREERLNSMIGLFENAALREFEGGYETGDIDGRMKRYAHVMIALNGGQAAIQLFVQKHSVLYESKEDLGSPMDCFDKPMPGMFSLEPSKEFFERLSKVMNEQAGIIDRVFPENVNAMLPFLERVAEDVISEYITPLLDEAHDRDIDQYLKGVTGLYQQTLQFGESLTPTKAAGEKWKDDVKEVIARIFDAHVDLYLQDELDRLKQKCAAEVETWENKLSADDAATESFFMSNVNREADKRDFLSSFKKVVLAPVAVIQSPFAAKSPNPSTADSEIDEKRMSNGSMGGRSTPMPAERPTTELAAKAALMNSRLEGIRTLFSLEVALNLVHMTKESLERAAIFARSGGQTGEEAREQCESIFISLLQILGPRHVRAGFDKAVSHLSTYNPRQIATHGTSVAPLVTFLELVNVGDLIQQMIDVFYEQELVSAHLTDRQDFLNPAAKEKKRFEQMLDERVAAGLNKGIDVLIDEVEHIFATTQVGTDFNPGALNAAGEVDAKQLDIGPSATAEQVVTIVSSHTHLLNGSTDKNVLDVFNQEVGMRLFTSLCKHIKRQRISVDGSIRLICDVSHYYTYISSLRNRELMPYWRALREVGQIYLIGKEDAGAMAAVITDQERFGGVFTVEEVYEFAARREDWFQVKAEVEKKMYGFGCCVM